MNLAPFYICSNRVDADGCCRRCGMELWYITRDRELRLRDCGCWARASADVAEQASQRTRPSDFHLQQAPSKANLHRFSYRSLPQHPDHTFQEYQATYEV